MNFKKIESVTEEKHIDYVYDIELDKNHYFTANNIITHNCRLLSDSEMLDVASQSNSFGAGGSISLGSHRVCTINFNRVALEASGDKNKFYEILDKRIDDTLKTLKAHKNLITKMENKHLQKFISLGWISLNRMFSTIGIIGLTEASETLMEDCSREILIFLNKKSQEYSKKYNLIVNIEQIPAESMAVRLCESDKIIFGKENVKYEMYANQFVPLWKDATIWERLEEDGKYNKLITGGGIVHAQIGEKITETQAKEIIDYAVKSGCEHFALNAIYSICEHSHTSFGKLTVCPKCGGEITDYATRVVGFFTKVSAWNDKRKNWEFDNRKMVDY